MKITADLLREFLDFNHETGQFTWKIGRGRARKGDLAGCTARNRLGYEWVQIRIFGTLFSAHRLAWLHHYGYLPDKEIDHINQDSTDNRITNLRLATRAQNGRNQHMRITNKSGVTGVSWDKITEKWRAEVKVDGRKHRLGRFECIDDAAAVVAEFRKQVGFSSMHGVHKRLQGA